MKSLMLTLWLQVMPYSTGCTTTLSNFEAGQNYKDVDDPAVTVSYQPSIQYSTHQTRSTISAAQ